MVAKAQKKFRVGASKGMRHESAAQVCTTHIWRSPRKLRKMIRKKSVSAKAITVQLSVANSVRKQLYR